MKAIHEILLVVHMEDRSFRTDDSQNRYGNNSLNVLVVPLFLLARLALAGPKAMA